MTGKRLLLHAALLSVAVVLVLAAWSSGLINGDDSCHFCGGQGSMYCTAEGVRHRCMACDGVHKSRLDLFRKRMKAILDGIVPVVWGLLCVALAFSLFRALKAAECGLCGGTGRLELEAIPPDAAAFRVESDCVCSLEPGHE